MQDLPHPVKLLFTSDKIKFAKERRLIVFNLFNLSAFGFRQVFDCQSTKQGSTQCPLSKGWQWGDQEGSKKPEQ